MSFQSLQTEHLRLAILQVLAQDPGYDLNETILAKVVNSLGHTVSRDGLRSQLAWLAEQGLVTVTTVAGALQVAKLTARGKDTAEGLALAPGVARPEPEGM